MYNTHKRAILYVLYGLMLGVCGCLEQTVVAAYVGGGSMCCVPSSGTDLSEVMAKLTPCAKVLSADCTRLTVVFHQAPPPSAQECGVVCQKVEQSALQMAASFYQLNIKHGTPVILLHMYI